ncbi:hypothetical protein TWF694_011334 [Orbilia ellipsospora]|uniref:DNA 3'-5' helicase n=1 Tax=Orbilia ellipsospora TaxID=2528407 RepID=A0AAV9X565_9PEZI
MSSLHRRTLSQGAFFSSQRRTNRAPAKIALLPQEILLNIAGYLSNIDVKCFIRAFPPTQRPNPGRSFQHWQRLLGRFTAELERIYDAIENWRRDKEKILAPVAASSVNQEIPEAANFDNTVFPAVLAEMHIPCSNIKQIQLEDIFFSLDSLASTLNLSLAPLVDCVDAEEGSRKLRCALEPFLPRATIQSLLPAQLSQRIPSMQPPLVDRILLTAYLLFSKLKPDDILNLLPKNSKNGYMSEQTLAEHFSYMLLFIRVYQLDGHLWNDFLRSTKDPVTDKVRWNYANGSPLSPQGLQILRRRLEKWFVDYHESPTDLLSDPKKSILTNEQSAFVNTEIRKNEIFKVRAYAGTGKTKCLVDYASRRPRKKVLYVAYNRNAKLDADLRFRGCANVDCKTLHSVAFNALSVVNPIVDKQVKGRPVPQTSSSLQPSSRRGKLSRIQSAPEDNKFLRNWEVYTIVEALDMTLDAVASVFTTPFDWQDEPSSWSSGSRNNGQTVGTAKNPKNPENLARVITTGIDRFCQSKAREPDIAHLSLAQCRTKLCNPELAVSWVKKFWKMIEAGESPLMTHDCYLKMFSLTRNPDADRKTFGSYDVVMFDEAQDANPCMANIILRQRDAAGIIIIGDPYQMIYGFRGARNECFDDEKLPPTKTFHLTRSFRFGREVADIANLILGSVGERTPVHGVNMNVPSPAVFLPPPVSAVPTATPPSGKHTVIFRTNLELVKYFFSSFTRDPSKSMCLRTSAANASTALVPLLKAGYLLYTGKTVRHPRLRGIATFQDAKAYLQREDKSGGMDTDEVDIQAVALIVGMEKFYAESNTGGGDFLSMLDASAECISDTEANADAVLTTAHQAKGLEWDDVIVADDFVTTSLGSKDSANQGWCNESTNLLYVACTRARKRLQLSHGLSSFFTSRVGTYRFFFSPISYEATGDSSCPCCRGKQPFKTFLSELLAITDGVRSADMTGYLSSLPSPCIGYEAINPRRNPSASNGWIDYTRTPPNPIELPNCMYLPAITCVNCVLAWRYLSHQTHGDLFRFAAWFKACLGFSTYAYHSDYHLFWADRFTQYQPSHPRAPRKGGIRDIYRLSLRLGLENKQNIGRAQESETSWSDFVFGKAKEAGVEYDDDDIDDFIMGFEE